MTKNLLAGGAAGICAGMGNISGAYATWNAIGIGADMATHLTVGAIGASQ